MGLGFAMLRTIFSEAKLGMAIGLVATTVAVSSSLGPAVSGAILSFASWRAVFGLLAALSLIALCMGWFALPNTPPTTSHFDLLGSMMEAVPRAGSAGFSCRSVCGPRVFPVHSCIDLCLHGAKPRIHFAAFLPVVRGRNDGMADGADPECLAGRDRDHGALRLALCGIGFALFQTPNNRLIMLSAPQDRSAAASGTLSLARQVGRACGTAVAALVLLQSPTPSLSALLIAAAVAALGEMR